MSKIVGELRTPKQRTLVDSLAIRFSEKARRRAEVEGDAGLRRLVPIFQQLPDSVTAMLHPTLGFLSAECCLVGPGRVVVLQTLHWPGTITPGERGEWLVDGEDLGRPDRKVAVFGDRLAFSGAAKGFEITPIVILTGGDVKLLVEPEQVRLIAWEQTEAFLRQSFPDGLKGFDSSPIIQLLGGK